MEGSDYFTYPTMQYQLLGLPALFAGVLVLLLTTASLASPAAFNRSHWQRGLDTLLQPGTETAAEAMEIIGTLPSWFAGRYYRNGPGRFDTEDGAQHVNGVFVRSLRVRCPTSPCCPAVRGPGLRYPLSSTYSFAL